MTNEIITKCECGFVALTAEDAFNHIVTSSWTPTESHNMGIKVNKTYLGDGIYAEISQGDIKLTAHDGVRATNTVFLNTEVWKNLMDFARQ